jgi:hypothetical protein
MKIQYTIQKLNNYLTKTNKCLLLDNNGKVKGFTNDLMPFEEVKKKKRGKKK